MGKYLFKKLLIILILLLSTNSVFSTEKSAEKKASFVFWEIWGYLIKGEENYVTVNMPVTDIGYFAARLSVEGVLKGVPDPTKLASSDAKIHLVIAENYNSALIYFMLNPYLPFRNRLLESIATESTKFAGVQIDFEAVRAEDKAYFISFLGELKQKLGTKILSVAIPARTSTTNDAYDYKAIGEVADRVIIMSYDEHWSGSKPGPVASNDWCNKVAVFAKTKIAPEKIVMGIPFYGRSWVNKSLAKSYRFSELQNLFPKIITANSIVTSNRTQDGIPFIKYTETIEVSLFYDDLLSLRVKFDIYKTHLLGKIAFWRIGQENPAIWESLKAK